MKNIKDIKDLEVEKLKLRVKQLELEKQMQKSWRHIVKKISLNENVKKEPAQSDVQVKPGNRLVSGALSYGASFLSHKLGMLAGKKIEGLAEQALEKLSGKINAAMTRKKKA